MCQEFCQSDSASHLWNISTLASAWEKVSVELPPPGGHLLPLTGDQQLVEERAVGERAQSQVIFMLERCLRRRERQSIHLICFTLSLFSQMIQLFTCNFKVRQWIRGKWALALCWLWPARVSENWLLKAFSQKQKVQKFTDKVYDSELQIFYQSATKKMLHMYVYLIIRSCSVQFPNQTKTLSNQLLWLIYFRHFFIQEKQCRRMDSSETL